MTGPEEVAWDNFEELKRYVRYDKDDTLRVWVEPSLITFHKKQFIRDLKRGRIKITPEFMRDLESPELKRIVLEAVCLARI
jgi:hypothetical protein